MRIVPVWVWAAAAAALTAVIGAEIVLTGRRGHAGKSGAAQSGFSSAGTTRQAAGWVGVYLSLAAACGLLIGVTAGWVTAGQFFTGYLTEYSLSLDNLFVFAVIMAVFAVPASRQPRVLLLGIGLALVLRSVLIVAGATALNRYDWLFYPLGGLLIWTAIGLFSSARVRPGADAERHTGLASWLRRHMPSAARRAVPPALLLATAIGVADVLFAFDSIPAVFGITTNASLVVACNVFALMGLRQVYVLTAGALGRIAFLNAGLGLICAFIGVKLVLRAAYGEGVIPSWASILVVAAVLPATVLAGTIASRRSRPVTERAILERRFAVIDTDGNGVWQREDGQLLTRRLCQTFGYAADSAAGRSVGAALQALFDAMLPHMDANGDSMISREEFVAAVGADIEDRPGFDAAVEAAARTLVRVADTDGNGVLDAGEYIRLAAVYGARAGQARRAFGRLDGDRNGVLDTTELTTAIRQFFASRDPRARGSVAFGYV
jgi:tellurite resistance protein TerC